MICFVFNMQHTLQTLSPSLRYQTQSRDS